MLDRDTKKRIDDLRNILVGKIPSPQSQVEQITTGLIYKFMHDMDNEAIEMGGVPSFFIGEYEKYSWKHLFNSKLLGVEKVKLYSDAIENLYTNPNAPSIFREIFKNSFLPFKDPSTLNMFLKEINEFHYSNSEQLGDAYEYLLSFMGSQGDAGQFRTPRHIIDFIIQIVNPQKSETILDPACGTSGFLISTYKHILTQNTQTRIGDKLNAIERKRIGDNLIGYDIDPSMTRISLVNMYLHNFSSPNISEYDTLSSEDKWNEYFDVILANPPFFSPTGGIKPHSRFGIKSTRAEVLFVDYIMEHLKPNGRAGIIVPEGIIFQNNTAYKNLRKKLIENYLVGVISLPAGVFQPYSGVKTSILILDKSLNQKSENIFFGIVENDGFSLGAQRTVSDKNDLPKISEKFRNFCDLPNDNSDAISKRIILDSGEFSLSLSKFQTVEVTTNFNMVNLGELVEVLDNKRKPLKKTERIKGIFPYYGATGIIDYVNNYIFDEKLVLIGEDGAKWGSGENSAFIANGQYWVNNHAHVVRPNRDALLDIYLTNILNFMDLNPFITGVTVPKLNQANLLSIKIPLPPIEIQREIVDELEKYQKIIDGCQLIIKNYSPRIEIDPSWDLVEIGEIGEIISGGTPKSDEIEYWNGDVKWLTLVDLPPEDTISKISNSKRTITQLGLSKSSAKIIPKRSVIVSTRATIGRVAINNIPVSTNQGFKSIVINESKFLPEFIATQIYMKREGIKKLATGGTFGEINKTNFGEIKLSIPSLDIQEKIVEELINEEKIVEANKLLMNLMEAKISAKIEKIWKT